MKNTQAEVLINLGKFIKDEKRFLVGRNKISNDNTNINKFIYQKGTKHSVNSHEIISKPQEITESELYEDINNGMSYFTLNINLEKDKEKIYVKDENGITLREILNCDITLVTTNGTNEVKSTPNGSIKDNIKNLPEVL